MRGSRTVVILCVSLVAFVGVVSAHDAGASRFDAPIPFTFLYGGAAATVGVTALWLGTGTETAVSSRVRRSVPESPSMTLSPTLATNLRYGARALFFAGFVFAIVHGLFGPQHSTENFATVFVWAIWVSGISLLSILAGSPWRVLSPWRTLYDGLNRGKREFAVVGAYPAWLRSWPALVGFVGLGIFENLTTVPQSPSATVLLVVLYAAIMMLGAIAFGREWFRHADVFAVLYRLFGRVAPVKFVRTEKDGYRVSLRPPWRNCTIPVRDTSVVVLVVTTVYTVSFDGFSATPAFQRLLFATRNVFGIGLEASGIFLYGCGLVVFVGSFVLVSELVRRLTGDTGGWQTVARHFAPTVLPIAAAYEVAHYYPFVLENLGQLPAILGSVVSVPIAPIEPLGWLTVTGFWFSQVILIVVGHVVAVIAAHRAATDRYASLSVARQAHDPLVALMIGYTVLSLWIIS